MSNLQDKHILLKDYLARGFAAGLEKREEWADAGHVLLVIARDFLSASVPDLEYEKFREQSCAFLHDAHEKAATLCITLDAKTAFDFLDGIQKELVTMGNEFVKGADALAHQTFFNLQTDYLLTVASIVELAKDREHAREYLYKTGEVLGDKAALGGGSEHMLFTSYKANGNKGGSYRGFTEIPDGKGELPVLLPDASPLFDEYEMRQYWKDYARANTKFLYASRVSELCGNYPIDAISQIIKADLDAIKYIKSAVAEGRVDFAAFDAHQLYPDTISIDTMRKGSRQIFDAQTGDCSGATLNVIEQIAENVALSCAAALKKIEWEREKAVSNRCMKMFGEDGFARIGEKIGEIVLSHFPEGKFVYKPDKSESALIAAKWLDGRFNSGEKASFETFMKREIEKLPSYAQVEDAVYKACIDQMIDNLGLNSGEKNRERLFETISMVLDDPEVRVAPFFGEVELETEESRVIFRANEGDINRLFGDYNEPPMIKREAITCLESPGERFQDVAIDIGAVMGIHLHGLLPTASEFSVVSHDGRAPFLGEEEAISLKPGM